MPASDIAATCHEPMKRCTCMFVTRHNAAGLVAADTTAAGLACCLLDALKQAPAAASHSCHGLSTRGGWWPQPVALPRHTWHAQRKNTGALPPACGQLACALQEYGGLAPSHLAAPPESLNSRRTRVAVGSYQFDPLRLQNRSTAAVLQLEATSSTLLQISEPVLIAILAQQPLCCSRKVPVRPAAPCRGQELPVEDSVVAQGGGGDAWPVGDGGCCWHPCHRRHGPPPLLARWRPSACTLSTQAVPPLHAGKMIELPRQAQWRAGVRARPEGSGARPDTGAHRHRIQAVSHNIEYKRYPTTSCGSTCRGEYAPPFCTRHLCVNTLTTETRQLDRLGHLCA